MFNDYEYFSDRDCTSLFSEDIKKATSGEDNADIEKQIGIWIIVILTVLYFPILILIWKNKHK